MSSFFKAARMPRAPAACFSAAYNAAGARRRTCAWSRTGSDDHNGWEAGLALARAREQESALSRPGGGRGPTVVSDAAQSEASDHEARAAI
jgi:hypothetical protein